MPTIDRIKAHLLNPHRDEHSANTVRPSFTTTNGVTVSIQQSPTHYCSQRQMGFMCTAYGVPIEPDVSDTATVEVWCGPDSALLEPFGEGPFGWVPLAVVAQYIDEIENN